MSSCTIVLTGRPPIKINEIYWPVIASASDKEFDNQYEFQANEISKWLVKVRQHADGRAIVYASYSYVSNWAGARCYYPKSGVLLPANSSHDDICRAIKNVCFDIASLEHYGDEANRWPTLANECIADMPAEELK